jgi:GTP-binding protein
VAPTVVILGRPNVGKSTLFNRLVGRRRALVDDMPGVTRDRIEGEARMGDLRLTLVDTAGLEDGPEASLAARVRIHTEAALADADLGLFLVDARAGLTPVDEDLANWLRRSEKPIILVANKCEGRAAGALAAEAWALGLGEPIAVSAEHGDGLPDLWDAIRAALPDQATPPAAPEEEEVSDGLIRLAVVGRPNVGKSSLLNRLLDDERLLTGPEPGLTRDAIRVAWSWDGREIELVDTAGLRRKARVGDRLEKMSGSASVGAIRDADVVLLVLDATMPLERQDLAIANLAIDAGRALVIAANKWDLIRDRNAARAHIEDRLETRMPQVRGVTWLSVSALTGAGIDRIPPAIVEAECRWRTRIPTSALNRWLEGMLAAHPPPMVRGRRTRIRFATQIGSRPPRIALFTNLADALPDSYLRYLANGLRETFDLPGVPLRLVCRKGENPYAPS